MPPNKSIFRQPGTKHFQLVHRSQRDPLIHDPDASQHVLKAFERGNVKKGKSRAELEASLGIAEAGRPGAGDASLYGIYYDDSDYDYMQHLRQVGVHEDGVESTLIEAPSSSRKIRSKAKAISLVGLEDLPAEVLPSTTELPRNYESQAAISSSIAGFQPEMDLHLRQTLEALEDDAFVDDDLEEDFFGELVADGERNSDDEFGYEFEENGVGKEHEGNEFDENDESFEARFSRYKREQKAMSPPSDSGSDIQDGSEDGDTVGGLPKLPVIGGKRRRKGTSDASGYSMTSSSMFRNAALVTLDERFDHIMEKSYREDEEDDDDDEGMPSDTSDEAPDLITSREDFEALMDDFLDKYEILGRKMKPVLEGGTGPEKLETLRRAMGVDEHVRINDDNDEELLMGPEGHDTKDRWDCETILTTYSNLENHPRLIRARDSKPVPKIQLDPRTGLPSMIGQSSTKPRRTKSRSKIDSIEEEDEHDNALSLLAKYTITRPADESKEEKKARKQTVKAERQARRIDKKATKEQFSLEAKQQLKSITNKEKTTMRKL